MARSMTRGCETRPLQPNYLLTNCSNPTTVCEISSTLSNTSQIQGVLRAMHSMPQRAIAEFFGTAALVLVGPCSVVATLTLAAKAVPAVTHAHLPVISVAFGLLITSPLVANPQVSSHPTH